MPEGGDEGEDGDVHYVTVEQDLDQSPEGTKANLANKGKPRFIINPCVGVLDWQTCQGGTRGSRLCGGERDRETENSKVCARTRDTRFIQVRAAKVANPMSYLGDQLWRPALGVGWD
jgi:hypothetical protein